MMRPRRMMVPASTTYVGHRSDPTMAHSKSLSGHTSLGAGRLVVDPLPGGLEAHKEEGMEQQFRRVVIAVKVLVLWVIFPLCLASICLSERAAAVTMGSVGTGDQKPSCDANGNCSLTKTIGGYSVPPGNPNDYGMCGILALSGNFARARYARIIVVGNSYKATVGWTGGGVYSPIGL